MNKCQEAFDDLKKMMVTTPILKLTDFERPFEVHTDASNFAIGGVLMQDGHLVAYESRKLQDRERRYPVHEKEMTAIIHCLHVWRHYLIGKLFIVKIDNVAASYFASQPKLSAKQARWQYFLVEFDLTIEYKPGRHNAVEAALSRKGQLAALEGEDWATRSRSRVQMSEEMQNKIKESVETDTLAQNIVKQIKEGKTRKLFL